MTRRFRLGLFLCLAAAVGLHVRPCALTLAEGEDEASACVTLTSATPRQLAAAAVRPALASMCDAPKLHLERSVAVGPR